jgi:[NiFe] hydrogenase diaphorase moiety small subunit
MAESVLNTINIDGQSVPFSDGQTIMDAAMAAGIYIPHLCHNPEFSPHGSCRVCTVSVDNRPVSACTFKAAPGLKVQVDSKPLNDMRRSLVQMLFVEGNHICPACDKSGNCQLQAVAYYVGMLSPHFQHFYPRREVDASHPDVLIDFNRCILCELCVRASREQDGKNVFAIGGRGIQAHLLVNSPSGKLGDSELSLEDKAAHVCPVGAIIIKRQGYKVPIGERFYDKYPISIAGDAAEPHAGAKPHD